MNQEKVIVIDFGGQYNQLVARRVRECNVYCEIYSYKTPLEQIKAMNPKGIILTGGPNSCYEEGSPTCTKELFELGVPVLGLCYGAQLMQHVLGGKVEKAPVREYGKTETFVDKSSALFGDVSEKTIVWMSHFDYISQVAPGFKIIAHTADCPVAAAECSEKNLYAIQFHPEVLHTQEGTKMLHNFVRGVCGCAGTWKMDAFVENTIKEIREKVGDGKVLLALSGGVDSSVAAGLLSRAIGKQLTCVFVDHGLLRKNEGDEVESVFGPEGQFDLNFIRVNAQERYYSKLAGVTEPEAKRKIIGEEFIRVFEEEAKKIGAVDFLAQGTIYPDVVESGLGGESAVIKSHHNVGGLPDFVDFKEIIEPLRDLFKDEVRKAGLELGIPEHLVFRQPFPGPGIKKERAKVNSRYGSEDARFTDIHMYNEAGEESRIFKTGEKVILDLGYHVDNKVTDAVFGFGIFRNDALWCYGTNTRIDRIENFDIDKDGRYKVELEDLNLIPGNYWVDITIEYGEGIPVDYYKQALKFEVVSNITDVGVTRIPHKWELHI